MKHSVDVSNGDCLEITCEGVIILKIEVPADHSGQMCEVSKITVIHDVFNTHLIQGVDGKEATPKDIEFFWQWVREQKETQA